MKLWSFVTVFSPMSSKILLQWCCVSQDPRDNHWERKNKGGGSKFIKMHLKGFHFMNFIFLISEILKITDTPMQIFKSELWSCLVHLPQLSWAQAGFGYNFLPVTNAENIYWVRNWAPRLSGGQMWFAGSLYPLGECSSPGSALDPLSPSHSSGSNGSLNSLIKPLKFDVLS